LDWQAIKQENNRGTRTRSDFKFVKKVGFTFFFLLAEVPSAS
jgi:hypothetical protein